MFATFDLNPGLIRNTVIGSRPGKISNVSNFKFDWVGNSVSTFAVIFRPALTETV